MASFVSGEGENTNIPKKKNTFAVKVKTERSEFAELF
jgi:hypothetical protein